MEVQVLCDSECIAGCGPLARRVLLTGHNQHLGGRSPPPGASFPPAAAGASVAAAPLSSLLALSIVIVVVVVVRISGGDRHVVRPKFHFFELRPRGAVIYMGARGDHCTHLTNLFQMGGQQPTSMLMLALNWKPTTARVPTQN